ncbi:MAG TPA: sulfatase-like hydrolase/transferase, partial [Bryobacteraceae bacterium]|nr:sulfatase-like hydrolase/transferase [Bryobacteraceae bacterium]
MAGSTPALLGQPSASFKRPNIVLILADEVGAWTLGCYGNREIRTPNLDLLARSGTRFLYNSVCTPAGSPSRVTLLTGRVPRQHGVLDSLDGAAVPGPLRGEVMLSDVFAAAGYNCGYAGWWDLGDVARPQHGFQQWHALPEKDCLPGRVTESAVQILQEQKPGQPFLLVVSHLGPRAPYEGLPQRYSELYAKTAFETVGWLPAAPNADQGREYLKDTVGSLRKYAAALSALDDQIPPLTSVLDKKGLRDDTLVVFTAATGSLGGRHGLWGSGRASDPINMFAESIETPLIWNWPGKAPVEAVRPELTSSYDLAPSLSEVTRVFLPSSARLCGRSYAPLALGQQMPRKQPWRNLVFGSYGNTEMARDLRFKVVLRNAGAGPNELYDLRQDARERVNQYENPQFLTVR